MSYANEGLFVVYMENKEVARTTIKKDAYEWAEDFITSKGGSLYRSSYSSCCKELSDYGCYIISGFVEEPEGERKISCSIKLIKIKDLILP